MDKKYLIPSGFKVISGGQTGADRAGLDWAMSHQIPHGGWCPRGRRSEDGPIALCYSLVETSTPGYLQRTEWNVRDGDATLIFTLTEILDGGSMKTAEFAEKLRRPWQHVHPRVHPKYIAGVLTKHGVKTLNIAGKRESSMPGISKWTAETLEAAIEVG